jgi:hypothetical protein
VRYMVAGVKSTVAWTSGCRRRRLGHRETAEDGEACVLDDVDEGGWTPAVNGERSRRKMETGEGPALGGDGHRLELKTGARQSGRRGSADPQLARQR